VSRGVGLSPARARFRALLGVALAAAAALLVSACQSDLSL
jgi:hypothetical protein